jgi:DNA invertase Pin-like site-specific DNA recombinase
MDMTDKLVSYFRVSTRQQGQSGLGLESQQASVKAHAAQAGKVIIGSYTEVESGRKNSRPQLLKALAHAKRSRAALCVAKLDRLSRNAAFLLALQESSVPIVCCDNPYANELTIGLLAVIAQHEAKMISTRTKDALAAYKARGGRLGGQLPQCRNLSREARLKGARHSGEIVAMKAREAYCDLLPTMRAMQAEGLSLRCIAEQLNAEGQTTRRGKQWNPVQVRRVLKREAAPVASV